LSDEMSEEFSLHSRRIHLPMASVSEKLV